MFSFQSIHKLINFRLNRIFLVKVFDSGLTFLFGSLWKWIILYSVECTEQWNIRELDDRKAGKENQILLRVPAYRERLGESNEGSDDCCVRYEHVDGHQPRAAENLRTGNTEQNASCGSQKWEGADKLVCHPESRCPLWVWQPTGLNTTPGKTPSMCFCPPSLHTNCKSMKKNYRWSVFSCGDASAVY